MFLIISRINFFLMIKIIHPKKRSLSIIILFFVVLTIGLVFYFNVLRPQRQYYLTHYVNIHGIYLLHPIETQDFSLIDTQRKPFTKENLKNHWTMLYFGFTHCNLVCPTTMSTLNKMYVILQKTLDKKELPQVIFITIDPENDSLKKIKDFVTAFNANFIGLKGSMEATKSIEKQLHIITTTQKDTLKSANSTLNHTTDILLINPEAKIQAYFTFPQQSTSMAEEYRSILAKI